MIGILFVWLQAEDRTRFRGSRGCTEPGLRRICDRLGTTIVPPCRGHRSLRHPTVLSFRQRAAFESLDSFIEMQRSLTPVQKVKINRIDAKSPETALTRFWQFFARRIMRINFRNYKNSCFCPWIASATISSAPPSPYISAVSIKLMQSSIPKRSASISLARARLFSPMRQVPWPSAGTRVPSGSSTDHIYFNRIWKLESRETFTPRISHRSPIKEWSYETRAAESARIR